MTDEFPWKTGWVKANPPVTLEYSHIRGDDWMSTGGIGTHLIFRDSGLAQATEGLLGAQYVKYVGDGSEDEDHGWHVHDLDWQFFILLKGSMKQGTEERGTQVLEAGGTACYPGLCWHREWDFSPDWEMIALRVPAKTKTITGRDSELPEREGSMDPHRGPIYTADTPESYTTGEQHERDFEIREVGSAAPTDGRLGMRIVRAARSGAESGWHYHSASTWFVVLSGSATMQVADRPPVELGYLDAVSIGPGPEMRHRITSATENFKILEMTIPAQYETTADAEARSASVG